MQIRLTAILITFIPVILSASSGALAAKKPTANHDLETAVLSLSSAQEDQQPKKEEWLQQNASTRIMLLNSIRRGLTKSRARTWVSLCCQQKGIEANAPEAAEEWFSGPFLLARNLRLLTESLKKIPDTKKAFFIPLPLAGNNPQWQNSTQHYWARVFPQGCAERFFYKGFKAWTALNQGITADNVYEYQAGKYHEELHSGKVCVVLGAGNISSIAPMDVLDKLFVDNQVVILKMSPNNDYLGDILEEIFAPLIEQKYMQIVYGGSAQGEYLCQHDKTDTIHVTGKHQTYNMITYGQEEINAGYDSDQPINNKPKTCVLDNVSPVIVVPGRWSAADIQFQARNIVSMLTNNAGFNGNTVRIIITSNRWDQRTEFIQAIEDLLIQTPARKAYYPGAVERYQRFLDKHPDKKIRFNHEGLETLLPWRLIKGLLAEINNEICYTEDPFCGICAETPLLNITTTEDFLTTAVKFCNSKLRGTLCATIIINDTTYTDPSLQPCLGEAISNLNYGTVSLNHWPAVAYGMIRTPWGSYPGNMPGDIQSGNGFVHNSYMLEKVNKVVIKGPFRKPRCTPDPLWFINNPSALSMSKTLFDYEISGSKRGFVHQAFKILAKGTWAQLRQ